MREIKFRGKCKISGDMVFGDLIHGVDYKKGKIYILPHRENLAHIKHCDPLDGVEVIPETVGQFTGLKDKNGVDIYEGDILDFGTTKNHVVNFEENRKTTYGHGDCGETFYIGFYIGYSYGEKNIPEIVGNIHDNPELL